jgi:hypothetical protein
MSVTAPEPAQYADTIRCGAAALDAGHRPPDIREDGLCALSARLELYSDA